jgi:hypothetical protein
MLSGLSQAAGLVLAPKSDGAGETHRIRAALGRAARWWCWWRPTARWKTGDRDAARHAAQRLHQAATT